MSDDIVKYLRLSRTRFNRNAEAADEIERLQTQRDRYAERFLKLQGDYADLLKVANTYYMACLHPQDPCKVCQEFEEHVHD